jgi:hypothetical protein
MSFTPASIAAGLCFQSVRLLGANWAGIPISLAILRAAPLAVARPLKTLRVVAPISFVLPPSGAARLLFEAVGLFWPDPWVRPLAVVTILRATFPPTLILKAHSVTVPITLVLDALVASRLIFKPLGITRIWDSIERSGDGVQISR